MKRVDLSAFDNDWFTVGTSYFCYIIWYFCNALFFKSYLFPISSFKVVLLKLFGAQVGKGVVIKPNVSIKFPWRLSVGAHAWLGEGVWIDNLAQVDIGENVCLSQGAYLFTGNHDYTSAAFDLFVRPIRIEDGAWVGAFGIVCPGVTLGSHAVLSAGSVANHALEPWGIYQGNPATWKKERVIR